MNIRIIALLWISGLFLLSAVWAKETTDMQKLTIFFTNDIHGGIVPQKAEFLNPDFPPMLGGGASAAAIVRKARHQADNNGAITLLIDGGDTFQGTLVGTESRGLAVVEYMNRMGYDASVPGNHEFDLGKEVFIEMVKASNFPWLAANIYDSNTGELWEWVKPWTIVEKQGLRIGLTGVATAGTAAMSMAEHIAGLEFRNEIIALEETVAELHRQQVDLVVVLTHVALPFDPREGYQKLQQRTYEQVVESRQVNSMEIAHFVAGIDVLLGAHLHKGYPQAWEDPRNHTICIQNYANGGNLGWINVLIDRPTRSIGGFEYVADNNALLLLQEEQFWPDSSMAAFVNEQRNIYEKDFREVVGEARTTLTRSSQGEATMNNMVTDAIRIAAEADFAFSNFGGIRAEIPSGVITREDVFRVMPFDNEVVSFRVTGAYIRNMLERKLSGTSRGMTVSGARIVFNSNLPEGERVLSITINGETIDPQKSYLVATSDYLLGGNSGFTMLRLIPRTQTIFTGTLLREAIINYIRKNSPLDLQLDGRWKKDEDAQPSEEWKQLKWK